MKNRNAPFFLMFFSICLLSVLISCGKEEISSPVEEAAPVQEEVTEEEASVSEPSWEQGLVTFITGEVDLFDSGEWIEAQIGDFVEQGSSIRTAADSYCEVQFGDTATMRIEAETTVEMASVSVEPGKMNVGVKVAAGSVLNKVGKLTGDEKYRVKTQSVICGVRGTEFLVKSTGPEDNLLAVGEGRVSFLPLIADVDELIRKAEERGDDIEALFQQLEEISPVVEAGEQIDIQSKAYSSGRKLAEEILVRLDEGGLTDEDLTELKGIIEEATRSVIDNLEEKKAVSEENQKDLDKIKDIKIQDISVQNKGAEKEGLKELVKVAVVAENEDAEIFFNDQFIGMENASGIFKDGEQLQVSIRKEGFHEQSFQLSIEKGKDIQQTVALEKIILREDITVRTIPEDATLYLDGRDVGRGSYTDTFVVGEKLLFSADKDDYSTRSLEISVEEGMGGEFTLEIPKTVENVFSVSSGKIVGYVGSSGSMIYNSDNYGVLNASDAAGNKRWSLSTGFSPNENSAPVLIGDALIFSGGSFLFVAEKNTGELIKKTTLQSEENHLFGRRVIPFQGNALFPANNALKVLDLRKGTFGREIPVAGGSRMTPAVYKDSLLIVDRMGTLLKLNPSDGRVLTSISSSAIQPIAISVSLWEDYAYFIGRRGVLVCVDLAAGKVAWEQNLSEEKTVIVTQDLTCGEQGVYAFSGNTLYAFSESDGTPLFSPVSGVSGPPAYANGRLYFGTVDGNFLVADAQTGRTLRTIRIGPKEDAVSTRPNINGMRVLLGTKSGKIAVINL